MSRSDIGALGEKLAGEFLEKRGFRVIEKNYRKPWGEIDIIASKGGVIRFVEVKTVSREIGVDVSREPSHEPEEMAHSFKLEKLSRVVETYMSSKKLDMDYQIDVVTVVLDLRKRIARCRLYEQVL